MLGFICKSQLIALIQCQELQWQPTFVCALLQRRLLSAFQVQCRYPVPFRQISADFINSPLVINVQPWLGNHTHLAFVLNLVVIPQPKEPINMTCCFQTGEKLRKLPAEPWFSAHLYGHSHDASIQPFLEVARLALVAACRLRWGIKASKRRWYMCMATAGACGSGGYSPSDLRRQRSSMRFMNPGDDGSCAAAPSAPSSAGALRVVKAA